MNVSFILAIIINAVMGFGEEMPFKIVFKVKCKGNKMAFPEIIDHMPGDKSTVQCVSPPKSK